MQDNLISETSNWWRFTEYEIRDSSKTNDVAPEIRNYFRYIRPTSDAQLQRFEVGIDAESGDAVHVDVDSILTLDVDDEDQILDWCRKYGLFGILCEQAILIRMPARYNLPPGLPNSRTLLRSQVIYTKTHDGWRAVDEVGGQLELKPDETAEEYIIQEPSDAPRSSMLANSDLFSERIRELNLDEGLGMYFPDVADRDLLSYDYPMPLSDRFWHEYGESIVTFRDTVMQLRETVDSLRGITALGELPDEALRNVVKGQRRLNAMASAHQTLALGVDAVEASWAFSSLLAMFASAAQTKILGGEAVRRCERPTCRGFFMTAVKSKRYCSERCRRSEEKARSRRKQEL